jgi:hypothetical protein
MNSQFSARLKDFILAPFTFLAVLVIAAWGFLLFVLLILFHIIMFMAALIRFACSVLFSGHLMVILSTHSMRKKKKSARRLSEGGDV